SFFGGGFGGSSRSNPNAPRRGQDIQTEATIDFMDACNGKKLDIKISRMEKCPDCSGSGAAPGSSAQTCSECGGSGQVKTAQRTPFGMISSQRPCTRCGGKGTVISNPCPKCKGVGRISVPKTVTVTVPAGIDDGQTLRDRGNGHNGINGGPSGDLLVTINVRPDPIFERDGFDIHTKIPITYSQAVLGDSIKVPTIDGSVNLTVPEGTPSGKVFRVKGKGVKKLNRNERGDQFVTVNVEIPKGLNKTQKDLLKKFEESLGDGNYNNRKSFFEKVKNILQQ
ncbi:MAG: J domain-containing protein, partial [Oscillospiraceae bacterium]|nr:J domain-containing protein [Oscillospiraceae bacterium]